ncbi:MAG: hypothetical protein S4CHLAM20_12210 [Chlamydiia bacterium]|nr:hypothetical protein [Chlamydiia bacterium]
MSQLTETLENIKGIKDLEERLAVCQYLRTKKIWELPKTADFKIQESHRVLISNDERLKKRLNELNIKRLRLLIIYFKDELDKIDLSSRKIEAINQYKDLLRFIRGLGLLLDWQRDSFDVNEFRDIPDQFKAQVMTETNYMDVSDEWIDNINK